MAKLIIDKLEIGLDFKFHCRFRLQNRAVCETVLFCNLSQLTVSLGSSVKIIAKNGIVLWDGIVCAIEKGIDQMVSTFKLKSILAFSFFNEATAAGEPLPFRTSLPYKSQKQVLWYGVDFDCACKTGLEFIEELEGFTFTDSPAFSHNLDFSAASRCNDYLAVGLYPQARVRYGCKWNGKKVISYDIKGSNVRDTVVAALG